MCTSPHNILLCWCFFVELKKCVGLCTQSYTIFMFVELSSPKLKMTAILFSVFSLLSDVGSLKEINLWSLNQFEFPSFSSCLSSDRSLLLFPPLSRHSPSTAMFTLLHIERTWNNWCIRSFPLKDPVLKKNSRLAVRLWEDLNLYWLTYETAILSSSSTSFWVLLLAKFFFIIFFLS